MSADLCIIGGAGHVGLPLALAFANKGMRVHICDLNESALEVIQNGQMPFSEDGAEELLRKALDQDLLSFSTDTASISGSPIVVVTIATPVDEFLNPDTHVMKRWADETIPHFSDDQLLILRSTVYPGTTNWLERYLRAKNRQIRLAYCPERIAQGRAVRELCDLPQIVSGTSPEAEDESAKLFEHLAPEVIRLTPLEAEFAKLFTNSYRYIVFGVINQFYMLATQHGADFHRILHACRHNYPRMTNTPDAGLTAGPCLLKDTMQLAAFSNNHFSLGHDAMLVNEGLPAFLIEQVKREVDLSNMTAGILGMAFKGDSDDIRDSLSFRLRKLLLLEAKEVLCSDPFVNDSRLVDQNRLLAESDVIFVATPHRAYRDLQIPGHVKLVDVWNCVRKQP